MHTIMSQPLNFYELYFAWLYLRTVSLIKGLRMPKWYYIVISAMDKQNIALYELYHRNITKAVAFK
jgi:hypothetical protein